MMKNWVKVSLDKIKKLPEGVEAGVLYDMKFL